MIINFTLASNVILGGCALNDDIMTVDEALSQAKYVDCHDYRNTTLLPPESRNKKNNNLICSHLLGL
jgi:hypothetical protein